MIQCHLKLSLTQRQERQLSHWLRHLSSVWNWGVRKIEQDARDGFYYSSLTFRNLLNGHGAKIGVPQDAICGTLATAHEAWRRCFKKITRRPRLKGYRNRLNSIAFAHGTKVYGNKVAIRGIGRVRFHKQGVPEGHIGQMRVVKRASGWYLCLFIQAEPNAVPRAAHGQIGIDPGFKNLLAFSTGDKVPHPRELEASALRLAQAQRGHDRWLTARIGERVANQRKDRNHKLSRQLVSENILIAFSKDNHKAVAKRFGKSVCSSGHGQLRSMLTYKCRTGGSEYVEPVSRNSTRRCSACGALNRPYGTERPKGKGLDV